MPDANPAAPARVPHDWCRVGIALVAGAAAVLSFSALRELAVVTGTSPKLAWLLPVAIDAAAGVSTVVWLRGERPEAVKLARRLAWSTIVLSIVGNAVQHAHTAAGARPHWVVAVAVGAVAPAIFGAVVHLAMVAWSPAQAGSGTGGVRLRWDRVTVERDAPRQPSTPLVETVAARPASPAQPDKATGPLPREALPASGNAGAAVANDAPTGELLEQLREMAAGRGKMPAKRAARDTLRVSWDRLTPLYEQVQAERSTDAAAVQAER